MKMFLKYSTLVIAAGSLGACQSFPVGKWVFGNGKDQSRSQQQKMLAASGDVMLADGKEQLRTGNISAAVAAFRIASLDETVRADANNGLAVAYAKLGRPDLAERYFRTALMMEPDNMKFRANLLRLQQQVMLARRSAAETAAEPMVAELAPVATPAAAKPEAQTASTSGRVRQVARGVVHISSLPATAAAPDMVVAYRAPSKVEAAARAKAEADRIEQSDPDKQAVSPAPKAKPYPVRVSFN
ncbi:tetratricopeptide repeat protein [Altererythrobacter aquiaggeris]|uniref:tetratricopeptide repeat protein n=1 Tax=Aestuarierythrobacter aquiaggeris TaxID=1898396 RepID=UPI003017B296